jgi:glucose/arabinose dehydrogenase
MPGGAVSLRRWALGPLSVGLAVLVGGLGAASAGASVGAARVGQFDYPMQIENAPGEPNLLFIVERPGRVQVLDHGVRAGTPFLDISSIVLGVPDPGAGNEQGLTSIAFAPDYETSGLFYVCFTNAEGDVEVDEFRRSAGSPLRADRSSRRRVLRIPHRESQFHNGGLIQFGPDGYLYLGTGDGGTGGAYAPDLSSLLGKMLRIDPRQGAAGPYRVPSTNPYVGRPGRDEIFAYGLRNPWRFSFDGQRIVIGDVGQGAREEVDYLSLAAASGANFGWPNYEGNLLYDPSFPGPDPVTFPVYAYRHNAGACAVVGGFVVRDPDLPSLYGRYVFGDFCRGWLRSFVPQLSPPDALDTRPVGVTRQLLTTIGEGPGRRIYLGQFTGEVWRLVETP